MNQTLVEIMDSIRLCDGKYQILTYAKVLCGHTDQINICGFTDKLITELDETKARPTQDYLYKSIYTQASSGLTFSKMHRF